MVTIDAKPTPLTIDPSSTAVIVVDMQNDFGAPAGMFARAGIDISAIQAVVEPTSRVLRLARRAGMPIVYLKMEFDGDLSNLGSVDAPNRLRHLAFGVGERSQPPAGNEGRYLIRDTWNTDILPALAPEDGDLVVAKHRYSGFFETSLHSLLTERGVKCLIFTGCTTSVCVESTLRDAFYRDYSCLLLSDCSAEPIGEGLARTNHEASLLVIETLFGWVAESAALLGPLEQALLSGASAHTS